MIKNPSLYEINTRVWLRRFDNGAKQATLKDVPPVYWDELAEKGINIVWLMGIWKTSRSTAEKYCFKDYLVKSYQKALKDFRHEDVIGSPYAITSYEVSPEIGDANEILKLKQELNDRGMKLVLDFVPNHFSAETNLLNTNPEVFLPADEEIFKRDPYTYFKSGDGNGIFAHGRDPFFPAWEDTVQVNYFHPAARDFMVRTLKQISGICDGLRCDMAMLVLDNVFSNTWAGLLGKMNFSRPDECFWQRAIKTVKQIYPEFIFIAEAYWDLEWDLQQLGFDFTYDKKFTERLLSGNIPEIRSHLKAEDDYQIRSVRFIENHDEERSNALLGKNRAKAAAVIMSTIKGMRFYHDGQFEGRKIKLPVQLGREPFETPVQCMQEFYDKLLKITSHEAFRLGYWQMIEPLPTWPGDNYYKNILAWKWKYKDDYRIVAVNYSELTAHCYLKFRFEGYQGDMVIRDLLNNSNYIRNVEEIKNNGLFVELKPFNCHIFAF